MHFVLAQVVVLLACLAATLGVAQASRLLGRESNFPVAIAIAVAVAIASFARALWPMPTGVYVPVMCALVGMASFTAYSLTARPRS